MKFNDSCAKCMYDRQCLKTDNKEYLAEIKRLLDNRPDDITSPQLVAAFDRLHEKYIGPLPSFKDVKKKYNDLVLSMEEDLREKLRKSADPLATSLVMATVITNGAKIAGTVYSLLSEEGKRAVDSADIILSKGQANYESFAGEGRHAFYALLCKCDLFINRFNVPKLTGIFVEE